MKRCLQQCFPKWPIRENELVTDTVDFEEEKRNIIDDAEFLKWYYFLFQLLYQSQRAVNWWCGYPTTFIHTFIGPGVLVSILNPSFFVKIHFGTEWNTSQNIFVSSFHFLTLPFLYHLVSYLFTPVVLLSFYFFLQKIDLFMMVIIRIYQSCLSETDVDVICLIRICIFHTFH